MAHGSFIRGLETTATFDSQTDQFVLNSPTISSTKWWPGALAHTSTHAIVMAQLYIEGKHHGLHGFIVPLRSLKDHSPLPGVEVGDIGPKFGFEMVDNGFLRLKNVRVPRENMLMKYAQVDRNGRFSKPVHDKLGYGAMVFVRATIVQDSSRFIARATTVAVRYSAVRKQFPAQDNPGAPEVQTLDYQTQQEKLLPYVAASFASHFMGLEMMKLYRMNNELLRQNDTSLLAELHGMTSGMKALLTEIACESMEVCRKSMGGHGYSKFCGGMCLILFCF